MTYGHAVMWFRDLVEDSARDGFIFKARLGGQERDVFISRSALEQHGKIPSEDHQIIFDRMRPDIAVEVARLWESGDPDVPIVLNSFVI